MILAVDGDRCNHEHYKQMLKRINGLAFVYFVTATEACDSIDVRFKAFRLGATDFLVKRLDADEFPVRVSNLALNGIDFDRAVTTECAYQDSIEVGSNVRSTLWHDSLRVSGGWSCCTTSARPRFDHFDSALSEMDHNKLQFQSLH